VLTVDPGDTLVVPPPWTAAGHLGAPADRRARPGRRCFAELPRATAWPGPIARAGRRAGHDARGAPGLAGGPDDWGWTVRRGDGTTPLKPSASAWPTPPADLACCWDLDVQQGHGRANDRGPDRGPGPRSSGVIGTGRRPEPGEHSTVPRRARLPAGKHRLPGAGQPAQPSTWPVTSAPVRCCCLGDGHGGAGATARWSGTAISSAG